MAFPTPLTTYLHKAEAQRQKLFELEQHILRSPHLTIAPYHKQEPIVSSLEKMKKVMPIPGAPYNRGAALKSMQ